MGGTYRSVPLCVRNEKVFHRRLRLCLADEIRCRMMKELMICSENERIQDDFGETTVRIILTVKRIDGTNASSIITAQKGRGDRSVYDDVLTHMQRMTNVHVEGLMGNPDIFVVTSRQMWFRLMHVEIWAYEGVFVGHVDSAENDEKEYKKGMFHRYVV